MKDTGEAVEEAVEEAQGSLYRSCSEDRAMPLPARRKHAPGAEDSRAQRPEPEPEPAAAAAAGAAGSQGSDNWPAESGGLVAGRIG